jgi:hypothetical protein
MSGDTGSSVLIPLITAAAGLIGVIAGSWLTDRREREKQRRDYITRQLSEFYGPLVSLRVETLIYPELRKKMNSAAERFDEEKTSGTPPTGNALPEFMWIVNDDLDILKNDLIPIYRRMVDIFRNHMSVAEPETRMYFPHLVKYVQMWEKVLELLWPTPRT